MLLINKVCSIHTMEYYSTLRRQQILINVAMWINLVGIKLEGISQSQKD